MRLRVDANGLYTYPDVAIVCGEPEFVGDDTLLNPVTILEILSPSTEAYDRGVKLELYKALPSLRQYGLVAQDRPSVHLLNLPDGRLETYASLDDAITLYPGVQIRLADLYAGIEFQARTGMRPLG